MFRVTQGSTEAYVLTHFLVYVSNRLMLLKTLWLFSFGLNIYHTCITQHLLKQTTWQSSITIVVLYHHRQFFSMEDQMSD